MSLSTAEAEQHAASEAGKEVVYLRSIFNDLGVEQVSPTVTLLYEDSRAVIVLPENSVNRKASRHTDKRKAFHLETGGRQDGRGWGLPAPAFAKHKTMLLRLIGRAPDWAHAESSLLLQPCQQILHTRLIQESAYRIASSFGACKVVGKRRRYVYTTLVSVNMVVYRRLHTCECACLGQD